jgi:FtsP/CotA-like multicopper oxidase with cupredoxin domain
MITRRYFLAGAAALAGAATVLKTHAAGTIDRANAARQDQDAAPLPPAQPGTDYTPVVTPDGVSLPWKIVDGVKVYHLVAEEIDHQFTEGLVAKCWGYNGRTSGPTIEAVEGDRVRFYVTNKLPAPTTVHWHGLRVPNGMDGVNGLTQRVIAPGETFKYEFTLRDYGTFMYHPHFDEMTQQGLGMMGMFVVHPRPGVSANPGPRPDRDFVLMLSEWRIDPGTSRPNPTEMTDFNVFTINSKAYPGTSPLVVKKGERVRIRLGNLSAMDHHPIHLHGFQFVLTETDGGRVPESAQYPINTMLVPVGSTRALEFVADEPGDWVIHCHMTHHIMNQMGHGGPNMLGVQTGKFDDRVRRGVGLNNYMTMGQNGMGDMADMGMKAPKNSIPMVGGKGQFGTIDMGGMFTIVKVREGITSYEDPGDYQHPPGTVAELALADEMRRDGIDFQSTAKASPGQRGTDAHDHREDNRRAPARGSALYTCPMHPEVIQGQPGNCPKCGMNLVLKK